MWPFKRKSKRNSDPGGVWDGVEVPDDVIAAAKSMRDFRQPTDEMTQLFRRAVQDLGEDAALDLFLKDCDFVLARDEIVDFFRLATWQAKQEGKEALFKKTFLDGWYVFHANPNADTARTWLRMAPESRDMIQSYLVESCRGGAAAYHAALRSGRPSGPSPLAAMLNKKTRTDKGQ